MPKFPPPKKGSPTETAQFKVAAVTMCRGDRFFLERWINYYGEALGKEHLYVVLDGLDEPSPQNGEGIHLQRIAHKELARAAGDKHRIAILNQLSEKLFEQGYQAVIGCDSDEFLVVDPLEGHSLVEYLGKLSKKGYHSASALGIDVGQKLPTEPSLDPTRSILSQRRYGVLSSRYTKASVKFSSKVRWGSGFHRIKGRNFHIARSLYLFHTGYCCESLLKQRVSDPTRIQGGWEKHLAKRGKTIRYVTKKKAHKSEYILRTARKLQQTFRPLYALNKPLMPTSPCVVEIPSRFRSFSF